MTSLADAPLGRVTPYPERYDARLLFRILRSEQRAALGLASTLPFSGFDDWNAYELSWLDERGKPQVGVAHIRIPCDSTALPESKSLKLYLGSLAHERFGCARVVADLIERDLEQACVSAVSVAVVPAAQFGELAMQPLTGICIDDEAIEPDTFLLDPGFLSCTTREFVEETLYSSLFRSTCPITGQPDYGDVIVRYEGRGIDRASLLRYLVSYRHHGAFHETCAENIFIDIMTRCSPARLTVHARFTRRGGLDINPFRSNFESTPFPLLRTPRQ
jgi:7-cyano-7-deazaguanine reductase